MITRVSFWFIFLILYNATAKIPYKNEHETLGVVLLDAISWPKLVPHHKLTVIVLVSNKYEIGKSITDSIREEYFSFTSKATTKGNADDVLFSQVIVNGAQNSKLAQRIGTKPDFKNPKLFLFAVNSTQSVAYPDSEGFNDEALTRFISKYSSGFFVRIPGLLEEYNVFARNFIEAPPSEYDALLTKVEKYTASIKEAQIPRDLDYISYYMKYMKKIRDRGLDTVSTEIKRLQKLVANDKTPVDKVRDFNVRLNILHQFLLPELVSLKADSQEL